MDWTHLATIAGPISGILALLVTIYMVGFWKGKFETKVHALEKQAQQYPLAEMHRMVLTLWNIYVVGALESRPDLAERSSPFHLTPKGHDCIPDAVKEAIRQGCPKNVKIPAWQAMEILGIETIETLAQDNGLTLQQTIALLAVYTEDVINTR